MFGFFQGLKRSLVRRVSLFAALGIFVSTLAVLSGMIAWDIDKSIKAERELLLGYSGVFAAAVSPAMANDDKMAARIAMTGVARLPRVTYARLVTPDNDVWVDVGTDYILEDKTLDISDVTSFQAVSSQRLSVASDVIRGGVVQGQLVVFSDTSFLKAKLESGLGIALFLALIVTSLTSLICIVLLRSTVRPVEVLTEVMEKVIEESAFTRQVDASSDDEIGRLGQSFNRMMSGLAARDKTIQNQVETLENQVDRRTRQYRLAKEEAETANLAKSEFLATVSHEIRTPLNGMLVMSELLTNSGLGDRQKRYSQVIQSSGQGLLTIINDILDLSKVEADKLELEAIHVDLDDLIGNTLTLFAGQAAEKGLGLGVHVTPGTPKSIIGDPVRIGQVLTNLINNALKFTDTGGVVVQLSALSDSSGVRMRVIDTGVGIPEDRQASIFEAFSQADQSTTRKYGGTGLGLSISQKFVAAMNGTIEVRSVEGVGSIFECQLPLPVVERYQFSKMPNQVKTLIVDDGTLVSRVLALMFETAGIQIDFKPASSAGSVHADYIIGTPHTLDGLALCSGKNVWLSAIGERPSEDQIRQGNGADALLLPASPQQIFALMQRLQTGALRGLESLGDAIDTSSVSEQNFPGLRVVAADDNAVNREVLYEALAALGVEMHIFEGGRSLLADIEAIQPNIVLLDISMPDMDGYAVLAALKAMDLTSAPRIAALTAHISPASRKTIFESGFDAVVSKPFTIGQLANLFGESDRPKSPQKAVQPEAAKANEIADWDTSILLDFEATSGKSGFALRMINLYRDNSVPALRALASSLNKDATSVRRSAHALKSMSATVGAARLVEFCECVEGQPQILTVALVKEAAGMLKKVLAEMKRYETELQEIARRAG